MYAVLFHISVRVFEKFSLSDFNFTVRSLRISNLCLLFIIYWTLLSPVFVDIMNSFVVRLSDGDMENWENQRTARKRRPKNARLSFPRKRVLQEKKLFCTICNMVLDHTRKVSVASHIDATKHKVKRQLAEKSSQPAKGQRVINESPSASGWSSFLQLIPLTV